MVSTPVSQIALHFGVNDIEGTVVREKIYHAVGAHTPQGMTLPQLLELIRGAGKVPAERDSFYRVLREFGPDDTGLLDAATEPLAGSVV
jgi:aminodeoxyfutalosine synthase